MLVEEVLTQVFKYSPAYLLELAKKLDKGWYDRMLLSVLDEIQKRKA